MNPLTVISFIAGLFKGDNAAKTGGLLSGVTAFGAVSGAVLWLFGPGREWSITLNALELSGVALGAAVALEWLRRSNPPQ